MLGTCLLVGICLLLVSYTSCGCAIDHCQLVIVLQEQLESHLPVQKVSHHSTTPVHLHDQGLQETFHTGHLKFLRPVLQFIKTLNDTPLKNGGQFEICALLTLDEVRCTPIEHSQCLVIDTHAYQILRRVVRCQRMKEGQINMLLVCRPIQSCSCRTSSDPSELILTLQLTVKHLKAVNSLLLFRISDARFCRE